MARNLKLKTITPFLKGEFPENLILTKKLPKKYKQLLRDKKLIFKKVKKRLNSIENSIKQEKKIYNESIGPIHFLFSSEQLKKDILKKQTQYRSFSEFLTKLKEKKKYSIIYGNISKKFFEKIYKQAKQNKGLLSDNLLIEFEKRLDVLLFRICFCKNIYTARQYITHNMITVNGKTLNIPSYQVKAGDIISINSSKSHQISLELIEFLKKSLPNRQYKYIISTKILDKYLKTKKNDFNLLEYRFYCLLKKYSKSRKSHYSSRKFGLLEAISKIKYLKINYGQIFESRKLNLNLENDVKINEFKQKNYSKGKVTNSSKVKTQNLLLSFKQFLSRKRSYQQIIKGLRVNPLKPLHVEVSYKLMKAIVLYSPQKIGLSSLLDADFLSRSLAK